MNIYKSVSNRSILAYLLASFLVIFYVLLYKYPEKLSPVTQLFDPLSKALNGEAATHWFMYGTLYTFAILFFGIKMLIKHKNNNYQVFRTVSVMFFQLCFAFLLPQLFHVLHLPDIDLKDMWPLKYYFFFDWNIQKHLESGTIGLFMFIWGIVMFVVIVPIMTYFFGKRWYCSWVCGCGALAETAGDSFRNLSDKSIAAWKLERYLIHSILVFVVIMTLMVIYTYFTGNSSILFLDSYQLRDWYGFLIGFIFAGAIGTGMYPIFGSRTWCRFGCPLAAYMGIIQRFKSRYRITTNGGQCISCGNCSTHCEMGIDVRAYAQRGEDIVRASCVGCGICSTVCPRGVLNLENLKG